MRVGRLDPRARRESERNAEATHEVGDVLERPAEEHDGALDRAPAGKPADRLAHDGLERAAGDVRRTRPGVEQRAHVGLGEYGAARGDRVDAVRAQREVRHVPRPHADHEGDRVDEPAGSAGARRVHALLEPAGKVDDLGILAAELDDGVGLGAGGLHGARRRDDLLHERQAEHVGEPDAGRTRDPDRPLEVAVAPGEVVDGLAHRRLDVEAVATVDAVDDLPVVVHHDDLDGLRPCVYPDAICHGEPAFPSRAPDPLLYASGAPRNRRRHPRDEGRSAA